MDKLEQLQQIDRSQKIDDWNVRLYFLSRHPWVLLAVAVLIVGLSLGVAWFVQKPFMEVLGLDDGDGKALQAELAKPKPQMDAVLPLLENAAGSWSGEVPADQWIAQAQLSQPEKLVAQAYWASLHEWHGFEPSADLLYYAHYVKPLRHANELIGDHYAERDQLDQAASYYRREAKFPDAKTAREKLLGLAIEKRDRAQLRELGSDPVFASDFKPEHRLYVAAVEHRWGDLWLPLRDLQVRLMQPVPALMAAVAGLAWFLVALQGIQPPSLFSFRVFAPLAAIVLGTVSILPTLVSGLWMEETFGLRHSGEMVGDFLFFMLSVGPREEVCKLALVLPFIPICMVRKSRLEMLVCAGCVGLGFAIWENLPILRRLRRRRCVPALPYREFLPPRAHRSERPRALRPHFQPAARLPAIRRHAPRHQRRARPLRCARVRARHAAARPWKHGDFHAHLALLLPHTALAARHLHGSVLHRRHLRPRHLGAHRHCHHPRLPRDRPAPRARHARRHRLRHDHGRLHVLLAARRGHVVGRGSLAQFLSRMKFVEPLCYLLALIGLILSILGRRMIIMEAASISGGWVWAVRLLPLADIMFLARFWDSAKGGAITSLAGLMLLLPLGAKTLWDNTHPDPVDFAAEGKRLLGDQRDDIFVELKVEHDARVAAKQQKLRRLNEHMGAWYSSMSQRRASLTAATPEQLAAFNEEAAAYKALHEVTKKEAAELQALLDKPMTGWGSIPDEEYGRYLAEQRKRAALGASKPTRGMPSSGPDLE